MDIHLNLNANTGNNKVIKLPFRASRVKQYGLETYPGIHKYELKEIVSLGSYICN